MFGAEQIVYREFMRYYSIKIAVSNSADESEWKGESCRLQNKNNELKVSKMLDGAEGTCRNGWLFPVGSSWWVTIFILHCSSLLKLLYWSIMRSSNYENSNGLLMSDSSIVTIFLQVSPLPLHIVIEPMHLKWAVLIIFNVCSFSLKNTPICAVKAGRTPALPCLSMSSQSSLWA